MHLLVNELISKAKLLVSFLLPQIQFLYFYILQVEYKLGFQVDNFVAMDMPQVNISAQGEVPRTLSGESERVNILFSIVSPISQKEQLNN